MSLRAGAAPSEGVKRALTQRKDHQDREWPAARPRGQGQVTDGPKERGFPGGSAGKESACHLGDLGSIPGLGRSPAEGKGYPLQYPGLENSMDCIVHRVAKRVGHNSATLTFKERRNVDSKLVSFREVEAHVRVPMSTLPPLSPTPRQVALTLSQNGSFCQTPAPRGSPVPWCQRSQYPLQPFPPAPPTPHQGLYSQLLQEAQVVEDARPELREAVHAQVSARQKQAHEQTVSPGPHVVLPEAPSSQGDGP